MVGTDASCRLTYMIQGRGPVTVDKTVPANSRRTFNMADLVTDQKAGVVVECTTAGRKVMVERSTYWGNEPGGRSAGANTIGVFSD